MRALLINPQKHDISLRLIDRLGDGLATVDFRLGEDGCGKAQEGAFTVCAREAERIGDWFMRLSRSLEKEGKSK